MATHYLYVDSGDLTSGNATNFTISLPENLNLGPATTYRIDSFRMIHSIPTVTAANCFMYSLEPNQNVRVIRIPYGY